MLFELDLDTFTNIIFAIFLEPTIAYQSIRWGKASYAGELQKEAILLCIRIANKQHKTVSGYGIIELRDTPILGRASAFGYRIIITIEHHLGYRAPTALHTAP